MIEIKINYNVSNKREYSCVLNDYFITKGEIRTTKDGSYLSCSISQLLNGKNSDNLINITDLRILESEKEIIKDKKEEKNNPNNKTNFFYLNNYLIKLEAQQLRVKYINHN